MPTRNINLTDHYDQFVEEQVEAGKFCSASEVLRAALQLLEQYSQTEEQKLAILKKLATDGFESIDQGQGLSFASDKPLAEAIGRIGRRAAKTPMNRSGK